MLTTRMCLQHFIIQKVLVWISIFIALEIFIPVSSKRVLSGNITENITWLMSELHTKPVLRFDYEFVVEFPREACCPILDIYSTHRDYRKLQCFTNAVKGEAVWFNNKVHFLIPTDNMGNVPIDRSVTDCSEKGNIIQCTGKFRKQDFEPKMRYFLFGFLCDDLEAKNVSLNGLNYQIMVSDEENHATCEKMHDSTQSSQRCSKYYNLVTFPNVFGDYSQIRASFTYDSLAGILERMDTPCYKYLEKAVCITMFPPCLDVSKSAEGDYISSSILPICRETCEEFESSCGFYVGEAFVNSIHCHYFQYKAQSKLCYYEEVFCNEPDFLANGHYNTVKGNSSFLAGATIEHVCSEGYELDGPKNSTCLVSGEWSSKSHCTKIPAQTDADLSLENVLLFIGLPLMVVLISVLTIIPIILWRKRRSKENSQNNHKKRNKDNDAFVSYYSEDSSLEQTFVRKILSTRLEQEHESPFKLVIHERDFRAGTNIVTNIINAIHKSNSAIILLSQNYVNSRWCRDEFEWCVEESKKDPAFQLYVILMEPDRELTGLSDYMEKYLKTVTYLKRTDPGLLEKIIAELSKIRSDECQVKIVTTTV